MGYTLTGPSSMFNLMEGDLQYLVEVYNEMYGEEGAGETQGKKLRSGDKKFIDRVKDKYAKRN